MLSVFRKLLGRVTGPELPAAIPAGFPRYDAADFQKLLSCQPAHAALAATDYTRLLHPEINSEIATIVKAAGLDLAGLTDVLVDRYGLVGPIAGKLSLFYANLYVLSTSRDESGVAAMTPGVWCVATCGDHATAPNAWHRGLEGKVFDLRKGMLVEGGHYLLPGVAFGCTCYSRSLS